MLSFRKVGLHTGPSPRETLRRGGSLVVAALESLENWQGGWHEALIVPEENQSSRSNETVRIREEKRRGGGLVLRKEKKKKTCVSRKRFLVSKVSKVGSAAAYTNLPF